MRFGLELPCGGEQVTVEQLLNFAVAVELAGWDGLFFEDDLVYYRGDDPPTFDPWVLGRRPRSLRWRPAGWCSESTPAHRFALDRRPKA